MNKRLAMLPQPRLSSPTNDVSTVYYVTVDDFVGPHVERYRGTLEGSLSIADPFNGNKTPGPGACFSVHFAANTQPFAATLSPMGRRLFEISLRAEKAGVPQLTAEEISEEVASRRIGL